MLSGSPRAQGNTMQVLRDCAKTIDANGAEAEAVSPAGMKPQDAVDFTGAGFAAVTGIV